MPPSTTSARIDELRARLKAEPKSRHFYPLGEELRKAGSLTESEQTLRDGLLNHPAYVSAWISLGRVLKDQLKFPEAIEALTKAFALDSGNVVSARLLGDCYLATGDKIEAIKKYKLVHALLPADEELQATIDSLDRELNPGNYPSVIEESLAAVEEIDETALVSEAAQDAAPPPLGETTRPSASRSAPTAPAATEPEEQEVPEAAFQMPEAPPDLMEISTTEESEHSAESLQSSSDREAEEEPILSTTPLHLSDDAFAGADEDPFSQTRPFGARVRNVDPPVTSSPSDASSSNEEEDPFTESMSEVATSEVTAVQESDPFLMDEPAGEEDHSSGHQRESFSSSLEPEMNSAGLSPSVLDPSDSAYSAAIEHGTETSEPFVSSVEAPAQGFSSAFEREGSLSQTEKPEVTSAGGGPVRSFEERRAVIARLQTWLMRVKGGTDGV